MGWEMRRGRYRFYVVSQRRGRRVVHLTFSGPAAEIAAWEASRRREERKARPVTIEAIRGIHALHLTGPALRFSRHHVPCSQPGK
jgi:hypothetical protein